MNASTRPLALVTGASSGIGADLARELAKDGHDLVLTARRTEPMNKLAEELKGHGAKIAVIASDLSKPGAAATLVADLDARGLTIDVLVNNAGTIARTAATEHSDEMWDRVLEVNLSAQFVLTRELGGDMLRNGGGKIVFVASLLSFQGGITVPGYTASKSAVAGLTKALANEWAGRGVNVNAVAPGYVRTDNTTALQEDQTRYEQILARIPAGRWAEPEDIAGAIVFLSSPAADYVNGVVLPVDGGWLAR